MDAIEKVIDGGSYISEPLRESILDIVTKEENDTSRLLSQLTDREIDIFRLIGEGLNRREIARKMGISTSTIGTYRDRIKSKLNMKSPGELMRFAVKWTTREEK